MSADPAHLALIRRLPGLKVTSKEERASARGITFDLEWRPLPPRSVVAMERSEQLERFRRAFVSGRVSLSPDAPVPEPAPAPATVEGKPEHWWSPLSRKPARRCHDRPSLLHALDASRARLVLLLAAPPRDRDRRAMRER